ncbi:MAG: UDP-2,4-diacetamido-2,4,6-trideoxy-beta-L-altropyranose hydrolase [Thiotrichales bacterium]|nr:UDP-2,4-diacetamido-2,4,6-trideoxy-beta-L-altropyranose hydrolase [Thiotrichales bacterium]
MKVVIRSDASLNIGAGHIMRCLTLAKALVEEGAMVEFICREHSGHLIEKIRQEGFCVHTLPVEAFDHADSDAVAVQTKLFHADWLGASQSRDAEQCRSVLESIMPDWLIVDHYAIDHTWQTWLSGCFKKLMVIDDLGDRKHTCDLLLDQNYGATPDKYRDLVPESCKILTGTDYALLRPEFAKWRVTSLQRRDASQELKNLLVTLGGVDPDNYTGAILTQLAKTSLSDDMEITVVMGATAPHIKAIQAQALEMPVNTVVKTNVSNMAELMANADLAIGAAGATTWERCCLGLPTIQLVIAENQRQIAEALARVNAILVLESLYALPDLIKNAQLCLNDLSRVCRQIVDGKGVLRTLANLYVATESLPQSTVFYDVLSYQSASAEDVSAILAMRNHPDIRKWMYQSEPIGLDEHKAFIEALKERKDRCFLLVKLGGEIIGTINFTQINDEVGSAEFGIYANPFNTLKGKGRVLIRLAEYYAQQNLKLSRLNLEVFTHNLRAQNLYKDVGFEFVEEREVHGHKVVCMSKKFDQKDNVR